MTDADVSAPAASTGVASAVLLFGEMLVDRFGPDRVVGGAPLNVARHLAAFGHPPLMLGALGDDGDGRLVLAELERYGMRRDGVQVSATHPTGVVDVSVDADGEHLFFIRGTCAWDAIDARPALAMLESAPSTAWLYAGTLALRSPISRATGLALLRAHRGPKFIDLNWREGHVARETALEAIGLADVLKVNEAELALVGNWLGLPRSEGDSAAAAAALQARLGFELLLVTRGAIGALAVSACGTCLSHAGDRQRARVVDTVGAGDAFSAVVLAGLLRGWDIQTTLARGNDFASRICEATGAVPADIAAYGSWTKFWSDAAQPLRRPPEDGPR